MVERCIWANQEGEIHLKFYRMACIQANWNSTAQFWSVALEIEMVYLLFLQSKKKVFAMDFCVRHVHYALLLSICHCDMEMLRKTNLEVFHKIDTWWNYFWEKF